MNVPVAVAALIAGARFVPETKDPGARRPFVAGAVLLASSLVAIVYPLLEGRQLGWPDWVWPLMAAGVAKGSGVPQRDKVGRITRDQVREIATTKLPDLNANDVDAAMKIVEGTARSMGVTVAD